MKNDMSNDMSLMKGLPLFATKLNDDLVWLLSK